MIGGGVIGCTSLFVFIYQNYFDQKKQRKIIILYNTYSVSVRTILFHHHRFYCLQIAKSMQKLNNNLLRMELDLSYGSLIWEKEKLNCDRIPGSWFKVKLIISYLSAPSPASHLVTHVRSWVPKGGIESFKAVIPLPTKRLSLTSSHNETAQQRPGRNGN